MDTQKTRTWAEIDLDSIEKNIAAMKARLSGNTKFLGVVKANAYGHGAVQVARVLERCGAGYLAVACLDEAKQLRDSGITLPILILGYTPPEYTAELIKYTVTQAVSSLEMAKAMSQQARRCGGSLKIHLKADSGMTRTGFMCANGRDPSLDMAQAMALENLYTEGIFTHFAVSDEAEGEEFTNSQLSAFNDLCDRLETLTGKKFLIRHCANSGAMIKYPKAYIDMVRPGIMLYGLYPAGETGGIRLYPAMSLKTRIAQIKQVQPGDTISYGRTYTAHKPLKIAVIMIGYADGLHRCLSGKIDVLVRGKRCPQVGRICMDMCMVDVTDVPQAQTGDAVTVFGRDGEELIPVEELAEKAGSISYELLCSVAPRVPRVYTKSGRSI